VREEEVHVKLGFLTAVLNDLPWKEVCRIGREAGYQALELGMWTWSKHASPTEILGGQGREMKALAAEHGLMISALTCHINHLQPDAAEREALNQHFGQVIRCAAALEVPVVTALSAVPLSDLDEAANWKAFCGVMGGHLSRAADGGVKIAIENFPPLLTHNIPTLERLFNELPRDNLGLNYDPSHFLWQQVDYLEVVRRFGKKIFHSHAKDTEIRRHVLAREGVRGKDWWRFRLPGFGEVDWKALLSAYREVGYDYVMSFEHEDPLFGAEEGVRRMGPWLRNLAGPEGHGKK
jgi:sugar phosphate isomerase/epimerase